MLQGRSQGGRPIKILKIWWHPEKGSQNNFINKKIQPMFDINCKKIQTVDRVNAQDTDSRQG